MKSHGSAGLDDPRKVRSFVAEMGSELGSSSASPCVVADAGQPLDPDCKTLIARSGLLMARPRFAA